MKLFDRFRRKQEPGLEGYQPHGAEAFAYLCPVCQRLGVDTEVCKDCKMECFPGFLPNVSAIKEIMLTAYHYGETLHKIGAKIETMRKKLYLIEELLDEQKKQEKGVHAAEFPDAFPPECRSGTEGRKHWRRG